MPQLTDIGDVRETVTIRGVEIDVCGVSAEGVSMLLGRFPELRALFAQRPGALEKLTSMGGEVVSAILAAGTGKPGNKPAEQAANRLNLEEQADLLEAIYRLTMPSGLLPFLERMAAMGVVQGAVAGVSSSAPATKSPKPSKR